MIRVIMGVRGLFVEYLGNITRLRTGIGVVKAPGPGRGGVGLPRARAKHSRHRNPMNDFAGSSDDNDELAGKV